MKNEIDLKLRHNTKHNQSHSTPVEITKMKYAQKYEKFNSSLKCTEK